MSTISENNLTQKLSDYFAAQFVRVVDNSDGCGAKFKVLIVSSKFEGVDRIERQRSVYKALESEMAHIHALTIKSWTPAEYEKKKEKLNF
eukprot:g3087.t1